MSPFALEAEYVRLIEDGRRAARWAAERDAALARGDRAAAQAHLTRYWRSVRAARQRLARAWPGLEMYARRTLASKSPQASPEQAEAVIEAVRRALSASPPAVPGVAGLYGVVRRLVRQQGRVVGG